jgi:hypothetical protein
MTSREKTFGMLIKVFDEDRVAYIDQAIVPAVLVTDFCNDGRIFRLVSGRVECADQSAGGWVTEVIKLLMQPAAPKKAIVRQVMFQGTHPAPWAIESSEKFCNRFIYVSGPRVAFHDDSDPDPAGGSFQEGRYESLIPEVVGRPENLTTSGNGIDPFFKKVAQGSRRTIRSAPKNLKCRRS